MAVNLKITPHAWKVATSKAKFNLWLAGRRTGKTQNFTNVGITEALSKHQRILWGDVQHGNILRYFDKYFRPVLSQLPAGSWSFNQQLKELRVINKETRSLTSNKVSIIDFRSADAHRQTWEGFAYHKIILNEAGIILRDPLLYKETIRPMMLDYADSQLFAIGVPKGKYGIGGVDHPLYVLSQEAATGNPRYYQQVNTSYDSPVATKDDIDEIVKELGGPNSLTVKQEIYAEFVDGVTEPFLWAFNYAKHVQPCDFNQYLPVYLAWDFNVESTCLIIQFYDNQIRVIDEYHMRGIDNIALAAQNAYQWPRMYINGDASGNNDNAGNESWYQQLKGVLRVGWESFHVPKANPRHKASWNQCNWLFENMDIIIDPRCKMLIRDLETVEVIRVGNKIEINKSDESKTHWLDPLRYHINSEHAHKIKNFASYSDEND